MRRWLRRHRALTSVLVIALVLAAAFIFYRTLFKAADSTAVQYVTQPAEVGTLIVSVSGTGNLVTGRTYDVTPEASGVVTDLTVQVGDTVAEGQVLFVLENEQLDIDVQSAEIGYKQAQASVLNAEANETQAEQSLDQLYDAESSGGGSGSTAPTAPPTTLPPSTLPPTTQPPTTKPPTTTTCPSSTTTCPPTTAPPTTVPPTSTTTPPTTDPTSTTDPPTTGPPPSAAAATTGPALKDVRAALTASNRDATALASAALLTTGGAGTGGTATATTLVVAQTSSTPTDEDIEIAEQKLAAARIQTEVAYDNLEIAEYNLEQAEAAAAARTVTAPGDGVVTALNVADGDSYGSAGGSSGGDAASGGGGAASTSGSTGSSSSALTIVDPTAISAEVQLNEVDVPAVAVDQKATLTVDALPDLTMVGKVTAVDLIGAVEQGVVSFTVTIAPDTAHEQIRAGMTTAATIITEVQQDVLLVPSSAVRSSSDGTRYVEVLVNGVPEQVSIEVGLTDGTSTEIVSGLEEGQEVVVQTTGGSSTATTDSQQNGGFGFPGGGGGPPEGGVLIGPGG